MSNTTFFPISIVIPVFNEVDNVEPLFQEISDSLTDQVDYEVIMVDDGSQDGTRDKLHQLSQQHAHFNPVFHQKNAGQSVAMVNGVRAAQHEWIITMDGDRQNDAKDIITLLKQNQDRKRWIVVGNRKKRNDNWLRRFSSRFANRVRQWLLRDDCPDTGCSLKFFPRDAFLALPHFNHCHRFMPALFKRAGFRVVNVPVNHRARVAGTSKYGMWNRLWVGIVDLLGVMWLIRRPCQVETKHDR